MIKKVFFPLFSILLLLLVTQSCSEFNKIAKSSDLEYKYEKAVEYYEAEEYTKALSLFDELATLYRGSNKSEIIHYYIANCHFGLGDYYFSGYYYKNFAQTYPNSPRVEEALFRSAYTSYLNSPKSSLDQQDTKQAIDEFQLFLNRFPSSELKDSTNTMIAELRVKLEQKAFDIAKLYYQTEDYKSATVTLNNVLKDFPESPHREEIEFLIVKSNYLLAINSIQEKKEERLQQTIDSYFNFVDNYKSSRYLKQAEDYYSDAIEEMEKIKLIN